MTKNWDADEDVDDTMDSISDSERTNGYGKWTISSGFGVAKHPMETGGAYGGLKGYDSEDTPYKDEAKGDFLTAETAPPTVYTEDGRVVPASPNPPPKILPGGNIKRRDWYDKVGNKHLDEIEKNRVASIAAKKQEMTSEDKVAVAEITDVGGKDYTFDLEPALGGQLTKEENDELKVENDVYRQGRRRHNSAAKEADAEDQSGPTKEEEVKGSNDSAAKESEKTEEKPPAPDFGSW